MKTLLKACIWTVLTVCSCAAQVPQNDLAAIAERAARQLLADERFTAASIAVYDRGESYVHHYGELDFGQDNPPNDTTLYEIASITKTMTGYLVACAVAEGKLTLDTPVYDVLGNAYRNLEYAGEPVRIVHLLTHTSGLPLNVDGVSELYQSPNPNNLQEARGLLAAYTKQQLLADVQALELSSPLGTTYTYSNVAPNLLAHLLEVLYDQPYARLLREKLWEPAGMNHTFINLPDTQRTQLANGYTDQHQLMPNFREPIKLWGAAGRAKSSSVDLLQYIKWQLDPENQITQRSQQRLFRDEGNIWLAYFWDVLEDANGSHLEHHGGLYGYQNWLLIYPEQQCGISIITNSSFEAANPLIKQAALQIYNELR